MTFKNKILLNKSMMKPSAALVENRTAVHQTVFYPGRRDLKLKLAKKRLDLERSTRNLKTGNCGARYKQKGNNNSTCVDASFVAKNAIGS